MEIKEIFLHKSPSKRLFRHRIHSSLKPADARGSDDFIYHRISDAYRQFAGQALLLRSKIGHAYNSYYQR